MFFILPFPAGLIVAAFVLFGLYCCTHRPPDHAPPPAAVHQHVEGGR